MNIHEYLKKRGFEMTDEFRIVRKGEHYLAGDGIIRRWQADYLTACNYLILKKLPQTYEFDGQTFEAPEGYVFERVGLVGPKDVGKYTLYYPNSPYTPQLITLESLDWRECVYVIFRKEN